MKSFYLILLTFFTTATLFAQTKINPEEADKFMGEKVTINGKITGSVYKNTTKQIVLNMGSSPSNTSVAVVINQNDRKNFSYAPENFLVNRTVSLTGKLVDINGTPGIVVTRPEEIKLEFEGGADVEIRPFGFDTFNKFFDEEE